MSAAHDSGRGCLHCTIGDAIEAEFARGGTTANEVASHLVLNLAEVLAGFPDELRRQTVRSAARDLARLVRQCKADRDAKGIPPYGVVCGHAGDDKGSVH